MSLLKKKVYNEICYINRYNGVCSGIVSGKEVAKCPKNY